MTGCDALTPLESEDDANMLQPSEQDPVTTDNETEENGQDHDDQPDLDEPPAGKRQMLV
jgi:hypothetical protein